MSIPPIESQMQIFSMMYAETQRVYRGRQREMRQGWGMQWTKTVGVQPTEEV